MIKQSVYLKEEAMVLVLREEDCNDSFKVCLIWELTLEDIKVVMVSIVILDQQVFIKLFTQLVLEAIPMA